MAKARSGSAVKKGLKFFLYGKQGTWKSSFALGFMKMKSELGRPLRVFYVDTEYGSIDNYLEELEEQGINLSNLFIVYSNTYNELEEWLEKAINDEEMYYEDENGDMQLAVDEEGKPFIADVIIVDSITPVQDTLKYAMIETSEKRAKLRTQKKENSTQAEIFVAESTAGLEFKDYDKLNSKGKNLLRSLITRTNKYVCVTSREKDKSEQFKKPDGSYGSKKIGVQPDCFKGAQYEFFTVLHMIEDEDTLEVNAQIERKDRTLMFNVGEIIENPTPELWQPIIDKNKNKHNATTMSKKYEDIVTEDANNLYKKTNPKLNEGNKNTKNDTIDNDKSQEIDETDPKSIIKAIVDLRKSMSPSKKQALSANFTKEKLPKQPKETTPIEDLLNMLKIAKDTK